MKFIKISAPVSKEDLFHVILDNELVNRGVRFDKYIPEMRVKRGKGNPDRLKITCQIKNSPTKDNAFLEGTYFRGRLTEKNGVTTLKGYIVTAPIYHFILLCLTVFFIAQCFIVGGFNPTPVILVAFSICMFWREFQKQGLIERYIYRAFRKTKEKEQ